MAACVFLLQLLLLFSIAHLLHPIAIAAQAGNGNVSLGSTLTADEGQSTRWLSPSGDFAFGFCKQNGKRFFLAIWYDKIPEKTVVWMANRNSPVEERSRVELTRDGRLRLIGGSDGVEKWIANATSAADYGAMLDTGNFVLARKSSSGYLWQSFENPTDTILPSQEFIAGSHALTSQRSETNFSEGWFILKIKDILNLYTKNEISQLELFWSLESSSNGKRLFFKKSGDLYTVLKNNSNVQLTRPQDGLTYSTRDFYHRAILEYDGVLRYYVLSKSTNSDSWNLVWHHPENICTVGAVTYRVGRGPCAFNSICRIKDKKTGRAICECIPGHSYVDSSDTRSGCKSDTPRGCKLPFDMKTLNNVDWPYHDYDKSDPSLTENRCKKWCEDDCLCVTVLYRDQSCWKKMYPFQLGYEKEENDVKAFVKVWRNDSSSTRSIDINEMSKGVKHLHIVIITAFLLLALIAFLSFCYYQRWKAQRFITRGKEYLSNLHHFSYKALRLLTSEFSHELGRGSFGTVYKGKMTSNFQVETTIAVKRLNKNNITEGDEKEFKTEVDVIGQTHHKNLVKLVGYCDECEHRLLVYVFMSNGSLSNLLFGATNPCWSQRVKIAVGIARGLSYLHDGCNNPIIHCDIKPQNILLDDDFNAKISDFGLAKLLKANQSRTCTGIRGTRGYVAPEWFRNTNVTVKVDVYSFGVMLLEIISCRRSIEPALEEKGEAVLVDWAYDCYQGGRMHKLLPEGDERDTKTLKQLEGMVMVAIWCVQEEASLRPSMSKVGLMLEEAIEVPHPPYTLDISVASDLCSPAHQHFD